VLTAWNCAANTAPPTTDNLPTLQAMLDPTWQHRQQQQPQPPLQRAGEAGQQQRQQPAESEPAQEAAPNDAEGSQRCPSKRTRINSPEHSPTASALLATKPTPRLGLELLCDSQEDAEAAEHLLRHAYCLPLPACPVMLVRVLLLANKYQVELGELVDSLWNAQYDMEALKLLEEAAQLEVPRTSSGCCRCASDRPSFTDSVNQQCTVPQLAACHSIGFGVICWKSGRQVCRRPASWLPGGLHDGLAGL
jgi:hypothetical protein